MLVNIWADRKYGEKRVQILARRPFLACPLMNDDHLMQVRGTHSLVTSGTRLTLSLTVSFCPIDHQ